jgi:hypothetical protein
MIVDGYTKVVLTSTPSRSPVPLQTGRSGDHRRKSWIAPTKVEAAAGQETGFLAGILSAVNQIANGTFQNTWICGDPKMLPAK